MNDSAEKRTATSKSLSDTEMDAALGYLSEAEGEKTANTTGKAEQHELKEVEKSESTLALEVLAGDLGRKGETIQSLEHVSGCRIGVIKESGWVEVEIQGEQEARDKCLELVLQEVSFAKAVDGTILKDEFVFAPYIVPNNVFV